MTFIKQNILELPSPINISYIWNWGSILGLSLLFQIITGILLTINYVPHTRIRFIIIAHLLREVNIGWIIKYLHINGASIIFLALYSHIARSLYFLSHKRIEVWNRGVIIYIIAIATAFIGYLLPWGQIRFWGATVITNLFSAIPYWGPSIVEWLWGGFAVSSPTLNRFFSLHFLMPLVIVVIVGLHLLFLHNKGSNNPLGLSRNYNKIVFHPYFTWKDFIGFAFILLLLVIVSFIIPNILNDSENFILANPLLTPTHIKPEWYFLWAYAILRSIPNKLGGVCVIIGAIIIMFGVPQKKIVPLSTRKTNKIIYWALLGVFILLTWIGGRPVEAPYVIIGIVLTVRYFYVVLFNILK